MWPHRRCADQGITRNLGVVKPRSLGAGNGILKVAKMVGCGSGSVQRVKREMAAIVAEAA
jgi:hypothetical protein